MKIMCLVSDFDASRLLRNKQPLDALSSFGVEYDEYCFLPVSSSNQFWDLVDIIKDYDVVIIQRCYLLASVQVVKAACEFNGAVCLFETDDDYLSLQPDNPAYYAVASNQELYHNWLAASGNEKEKLLPELEASRLQGINEYKTILRMADYITVTNDILARTIYPYNKNVRTFQNNIEKVFPWRDSVDIQEVSDGSGKVEIPNTMGFFIIPDHAMVKGKMGDERRDFVRIGYSTSPSRKGLDWDTVKDAHNEWVKSTDANHYTIFIEDPREQYFYRSLTNQNLAIMIPYTPYEKYMQNYRNFDIALAPLEPTAFNTSRSEIKLLEAAAWKIPGLVPNLQTYTRTFTDEVNCLTYNNADEYKEKLYRLVKSASLRKRLGEAAYELVKEGHLEKHHAAARYEFLKECINSKKRMRCIK